MDEQIFVLCNEGYDPVPYLLLVGTVSLKVLFKECLFVLYAVVYDRNVKQHNEKGGKGTQYQWNGEKHNDSGGVHGMANQ